MTQVIKTLILRTRHQMMKLSRATMARIVMTQVERWRMRRKKMTWKRARRSSQHSLRSSSRSSQLDKSAWRCLFKEQRRRVMTAVMATSVMTLFSMSQTTMVVASVAPW